MDKKITNVEVQEFLNDFEENSETIILEEGSKEKNEIEKIAEARGIKIKGSRDLAVFKTIYAFTDQPNSNGAILPKKELLRVLPQIVGKPININHERRFVVGHYIDYRYKQKDSQINAYGIYYKTNFEKEFEEAKTLMKKKKLSTSFEIWSPKDKRTIKEDGSYELHQMEIAGGALIYEDKNNEPAFKDAKVLAIAKNKKELNLELVYASKHKEDEIITCKNGKCELVKAEEIQKDGTERFITKQELEEKTTQTISKIKCSNCGEEFDSGVIDKIKCPKCFAILDKSGNMIYPPQIKDFKMLCPSCKMNNWLILSKKEDKNKVRCMGCSKEYDLTFATKKEHNIADDFNFLYTSKVSCLQCHTPIYVAGVSSVKTRSIKCKRCGLTFSYDISHDRYKNITKIEEVIPKKETEIDKSKESSEEGGKEMKKEVKKASEKKIEVKKEMDKIAKKEVTEEVKIEGKEKEKMEIKAEIPKKDKVNDTDISKKDDKEVNVLATTVTEKTKVEEKEEAKETPKAEKTPKTVEKVEEPKVEEKKEDKKVEKAIEKPEAKETPKAEEPKVEPKKEIKVEATEKATPKEKADLISKTEKPKVEISKEDRFKAGIKKLAKMIKTLRKEKTSLENKVKLYAENAKTIIARRQELGDTKLTDEEILNDDKFGKVKAEKELTKAKVTELNTGNDISGKKYKHDDKWYAKKRKAIDDEAFKTSE